jgi:hypothetical protein
MIVLNELYKNGKNLGIVGSRHPDLIDGNILFLACEVLFEAFPIHPFILLIEVNLVKFAWDI